jgi:uncharacterized protein (TIGR00369 family)
MPTHSEHLTPMAHAAQNRCFGCGQANPVGLHLEFLLAEDQSVVCLSAIPDTFEGPVGYVHGGIIATLLDETMSKSVRARGVVAMTRHMEVDYLRPVPSGSQIRLEGHVTHHEGRKHWVQARILNDEGTELAKSKGLFIEIRVKQFAPRAVSAARPAS